MFCTYCGKQHNNDSKYCIYCGKVIIGNDRGRGLPSSNANPIYRTNLPFPKENNSTGSVNIKFPLAALCYILMILLSVLEQLSMPVWYGVNFDPNAAMLLLFTLGIAASVFLVIILLSKKQGAPLISAVCITAVMPIITDTLYPLIVWGYSNLTAFELLNITLSNITFYLPYLLMICFAVYCNKYKEVLKSRILPKLWFVPGTVAFLLQTYSIWLTVRSFSYVYINTIHFSVSLIHLLLYIAAIFLLGYWIYYINSVRIAPKLHK